MSARPESDLTPLLVVCATGCGHHKNGGPRVLPFTTELDITLKGQLAEHERLKAAEKSARSSFTATANGS